MRRRFNSRERVALFLAADGRCERCGRELERGWNADHVDPWAKGGQTDVVNGAALCPRCNRVKGATLNDTLGLRRWQMDAVDAYYAAGAKDFLVVATPGAGKTRLAGEIARRNLLESKRAHRLVVVVPSERLKSQWATKLNDDVGVQVDPVWKNEYGRWPRDFHGIAVTYHAVASASALFRRNVSAEPTMVILDEVHHCGDTRSWGDALRFAFEPAISRLLLSGTPFRSDNNAIPFVRYVDGEGRADFDYGYDDALRENVCRSVYFPRRGGRMEWSDSRGEVREATFDDELDERSMNERLRTALSYQGDWLPAVLDDAHKQLISLRRDDPLAAGLVIATDQAHAQRVAAILQTVTGHEPVVAISDDGDAAAKISAFERSGQEWIVAVRMVSEGVDIPRLRVGVYATNITTELFFRQAVGRLVRQSDEATSTAWMLIPDDPRLRAYAETIKQQREHVIAEELEQAKDRDELGEMFSDSLYQPWSAEVEDKGTIADGVDLTPTELAHADQLRALSPLTADVEPEKVAMLLRLQQATSLTTTAPTKPPAPQWEERDQLKKHNNKAAATIAARYVVEHKDVNWRLNQAVGIKSVNDATTDQLQRRLDVAREWLKSGAPPG